MNKNILLVGIVTLVSACSTVQETDKPDAATARLNRSIVQMPVERNRGEFFFCDRGDTQCPARSTKVLAVPKKVDQPVATAPVLEKLEATPANKTYKVHFRWGWAKLDAGGKKELRQILAEIDSSSVKEIVIEGRTDPTGSLAFNKRLAINRANVVRKEFVDFGVSPKLIVAKQQIPCCDGNLKAPPSVMREMRRSDIEITIRQK